MNTRKPKISQKIENDNFKVLEIIGKSGDQLNSHKVDNDAVLQLLSGSVIYKEANTTTTLIDHATLSISKQQLHELEFKEDSKLLLFLILKAKMKFSSL